jgi:transposase
MRREVTFTVSSQLEEEAITQAMRKLGWRAYATNHSASQLTLEQAVEAYRDEYLVERNFARLKGRPLSLAPLYVQRDDHRVGLVRLLTIALRVMTLLEAFSEITLTIVRAPGFAQRHITPLSPLQQEILVLLDFSPAVYLRLEDDS